MMSTLCTLLFVVLLMNASTALPAKPNTVHFTCDLMEKLSDAPWQVVDSRKFFAPLERDFQFSMAHFGYLLKATREDSSVVRLESRVNCFTTPQRNFFDGKLVELGASIFFDSALVRGKSLFRIRLTIDSLVASENDCPYRFAGEDFAYDPSGDFDIYFVRGSLGDVRWNQFRDAVEADLDRILEILELKDPPRINFFIAPCRLSDIGWDDRWDNALDLSRNNLFIHFTHGINSFNPQSTYMLRLLKLWGYSPALLVEGAASLNEFCDYYARRSRRKNALPVLHELSLSKNYREAERGKSSYAAGSFVRYLISTRGYPLFRNLYNRATDLTLEESFQELYGETFSALESRWQHYLDTLTLSPGSYAYYLQRSQSFMKLEEMRTFLEALTGETGDTLQFGPRLANLYFHFGEYSRAESLYRRICDQDTSTRKETRSYFANLLVAQGKIKEAEQYYRQALQDDSTNYLSFYKLAVLEHYRGNDSAALALLYQAVDKTKSVAIRGDIEIVMGEVYAALGRKDSSRFHYQSVLDTAKLLIGSFGDNPMHHLRAGKAAVGLGEGKAALEYLQTAFFLEERMFYIGQVLLAMGQAHDLLGERQQAKKQYRLVSDLPTAYLDRQLAKRYLQTPYKLP